ncbi:ficolin-1 [Plakobranchus ocellatus]|uniref:Ficolin-1 n=1 Tax=Plakobranchus ocellatus TaxID=259542 RepID=A0AAV4BNH0_9GAST|nr:ficolin-1 [Plakobranchus ocellatus]
MHDKLLAGTGQIEDELKDVNKKIVALSENKDMFTNDVRKSLALLQVHLLMKSNELQSSMNSSTRSISDNLTQIKVSTKQKMKSAIAEAFAFRTCEKGMTNLMNTTTEPYMILPLRDNAAITTPYLCDVVTDGGGWTIIQRRSKGDLDFYRDWAAYRQGFGSLDGDFWLGNENIHAITSRGSYELRVDLKYEGKLAHAHYRSFSIDNESKNYALRLGDFSGGEAGDSFEYHKDSDFSTYDQDNDSSSKHCAKDRYGGWWYVNCANVNLNGKWQEENKKGLEWFKLTGGNSVEYSEMKIRPV